jgi:uncharacterized membrane protein YhiD involved in acid resistance
MDLDLDSLLRMIAAVICGGAIGFNRDMYGKPTGIRAHALISLGAAMLVVWSLLPRLATIGVGVGARAPDRRPLSRPPAFWPQWQKGR